MSRLHSGRGVRDLSTFLIPLRSFCQILFNSVPGRTYFDFLFFSYVTAHGWSWVSVAASVCISSHFTCSVLFMIPPFASKQIMGVESRIG